MTLGALRVSALALSAAAFVLSAPLSGAGAATVGHHYQHVTHYRMPLIRGSLTRASRMACTSTSHVATQAIAIMFGETDTATLTATIPAPLSRPE